MQIIRLMTLLMTLLASQMTAVADRWLTRPQLAERLQIATKTLAMWASAGKGPRYARPGGGQVRYRLSDVEAWEETQFSGGDVA